MGIFNCEVIYERMKEEGYTGGKTILRDYVRQFRPSKHIQAVCRYETKPGEQAQVDWGEYNYIDQETGEVKNSTSLLWYLVIQEQCMCNSQIAVMFTHSIAALYMVLNILME
ncbi:hypothetical protein V518_2386 [Thermoanaerobacterium aotearoense SCUT27]|uniref:Transposase n=2 Tax=Thermoanaerobacterium TaxID=28895 RepID=W9ECI6_9THEO|nr:hypothetical protein Tsac_0460 [Thermoanaerobacterium saccharolyticum JW/SL-YS485]ETO37459.1 hypothetical protein V518_2386 [Thermoanaerobacterium aotearoense SCUT27]